MPFVFTTQVAVKLIERSVDKITKNVSTTLLILAFRVAQFPQERTPLHTQKQASQPIHDTVLRRGPCRSSGRSSTIHA